MTDFYQNLEFKIKSHEEMIERRVKYLKIYNNPTPGHNISTEEAFAYAHTYGQMTAKKFMEIIQDCVCYVTKNNINYHELENEFRKRELHIYIIARLFQKGQNNVVCKLGNDDMKYEANFVVTKDVKFYENELLKFGYLDKDKNNENLKKCGVLIADKIESVKQNYPNDLFIIKK
ncbi:hypothetical protein Catovirus_1_812 [Catovirus CTV1]|uniref:Uncharacterized protein n=1 Tax=Catovirus CTV1 TaxID=1977631 RepID=A0A1V0SAM4_9VIRU|nr:hypothetical protein Catovirus_1_812 [Catovirus CTV1]